MRRREQRSELPSPDLKLPPTGGRERLEGLLPLPATARHSSTSADAASRPASASHGSAALSPKVPATGDPACAGRGNRVAARSARSRRSARAGPAVDVRQIAIASTTPTTAIATSAQGRRRPFHVIGRRTVPDGDAERRPRTASPTGADRCTAPTRGCFPGASQERLVASPGVRRSSRAAGVAVAGALLCHCSSDPRGPPPQGGGPALDAGSHPPASAGHDLVYDDALRRVLLVNAGLGGNTEPPSTQPTQLWAWDGSAWRVLDSAGPPIRSLAGVAYDGSRDVLVLHGGSYSVQVPYRDTWEWRADAGWRRIDVPGPGILDHTQMSYDPSRQQAVLFGGQRDLTTFPAEVWTFDGGQWTALSRGWTRQPRPPRHAVPPRAGRRGRVRRLRARSLGPGRHLAVERPLGRDRARPGATHPRANGLRRGSLRAVLVGGGQPTDEPLVLRDAGWEPLGLPGAPPPRYLPGVAYDRARGVLVLFGGGDPSSNALRDDTWELDAVGWRGVDPR